MSMTKNELLDAMRASISLEFADIPTENEIEYLFSEKFEKRMSKLIKREKRSYWYIINTASKKAAIFFIIILLMLGVPLSVDAIRTPIVSFIVETYETFVAFLFDGDVTKIIEKEYSLKYIPNDYFKSDYIKNDATITTIYLNNNGDRIEFCQSITNDVMLRIDDEQNHYSVIDINGIRVMVYLDGLYSHYNWIKDSYLFSLTCYGYLDNEEIEKMIISNELIVD